MTYRTYSREYRSESAEIGTAISNIDNENVIIITMFRPALIARSTKELLENLYNYLDFKEDQEKARLILKNVEGRSFEQFVTSTTITKEFRVQIAFELLKKMLRYDEFPNAIKYALIDDEQILFNENGVYLREIVNFTDNERISDRDIIKSLGAILSRLLPNLEGAEATLIEQIAKGIGGFYTIADVYSAFRDVFIYEIPAKLEKRIYIYPKNGEVIDGNSVDEFLRKEELRQLENMRLAEEQRVREKINSFDEKIANQTDISLNITSDGFTNQEINLTNKNTKQIVDGTAEFEFIRSVQPKTININEVKKEITSSLQEIVDEYKNYGKQKIENNQNIETTETSEEIDESEDIVLAKYSSENEIPEELDNTANLSPMDSQDEDAEIDFVSDIKLIENEGPNTESESDTHSSANEPITDTINSSSSEEKEETKKEHQKNNSKKGRKNKKKQKKQKKHEKELDTFKLPLPDEDFENTDVVRISQATSTIPLTDDLKDNLEDTSILDSEDKDSPFYKYKESETTKLDAESASDLDEFYKKMDSYDKDRKTKYVLSAVAAIIIAVAIYFGIGYIKQVSTPIEVAFNLNKATISTIECINECEGKSKIEKYIWKVYFNDILLEKETVTYDKNQNLNLTFKSEGIYRITLTAVGKDGKEYGPISKDYEVNFDIEPESPTSSESD